MTTTTTATFTLSLDLELLWGHKPPNLHHLITMHPNDLRNHIHHILDTLDHYDIPATWATVGHLFYDTCTPTTCPTHTNRTTYGYTPPWYHDPHTNLLKDPLYYGPDIIEDILQRHIHEIAYHSFSHPDFQHITPAIAHNELSAIHDIQHDWPVHFHSFVYPYNAINHLELLTHHGFTNYRGPAGKYNPNTPYLTRKWNGLKKKLTVPLTQPHYHNGLWNLTGHLYFCDPQLPRSLPLRTHHALHTAIQQHTNFHVWLHPWSLLQYPRLTTDLTNLISHVHTHVNEGDLEIVTMEALAQRLTNTMEVKTSQTIPLST